MCPFLQVKCFCRVITATKFNMTVGKWECSLKTHSRDVNVVMVLRRRLFLPLYYARQIWRANKDCHIETVTDNLELNLSTPASHKSNFLQMFIKCGPSHAYLRSIQAGKYNFVAFNHFQQHTSHMNMMLITARADEKVHETCSYHLARHHAQGDIDSSRSFQHQ